MARPNRSLFLLDSTGNFEEEPSGDNYSWVTVELPYSMEATHNGEMLLEFAIGEIENYRATIHRTPQHWKRYCCISFPVRDVPDAPGEPKPPLAQVTCTIMIQAEYRARHWLQEVRDGGATLEKKRIFGIGIHPHVLREMDE
ncbi:Cwf15/Cwc15 cell cycle control protein [Penicillium sp. CMV-2018d]|nr:Cwf15/Cwc15 cell cycle control protein [Penicillium sp. CMV-2018d]